MKRKFTMALALASFLALASALNAPANAQIGIGRTASDLTLDGQLSLADGTAGAPAQIFTSDPTTGLFLVGAGNLHFNATTWDRTRGNVELTLLASSARTAEANSADQVSYNHTGLIIVVDASVDGAAASIPPTLEIKDSISGNYFTIWTAAVPIADVVTRAYLFTPGGEGGSYTEAVNLRIGRTWRFTMTVADADSITYSASAVLLV